MAEAILSDRKLILPCAVYLNGEYGQEGIFFGVPAMLGKDGVEKVIEYDLNEEEMAAFCRKNFTKVVSDTIVFQCTPEAQAIGRAKL